MTVGKLIAERLRELDLNQAQLARMMLVSRTTVSNWVRDRSKPSVDKVPQLAVILDVDPRALSPFVRRVYGKSE